MLVDGARQLFGIDVRADEDRIGVVVRQQHDLEAIAGRTCLDERPFTARSNANERLVIARQAAAKQPFEIRTIDCGTAVIPRRELKVVDAVRMDHPCREAGEAEEGDVGRAAELGAEAALDVAVVGRGGHRHENENENENE